MRYFVLVVIGILSVLVSGSILSGLTIVGVQVDLVLLIALAFALSEKTSMPIIWAAATGIFMDILYSMVWGTYALSYTVAVVVIMLVSHKIEKFNLLFVFLAGTGGFLIKELLMAAMAAGQGANVGAPITSIFATQILPGAFLCGALLLPAYWLISRLARREWMRPRPSYNMDEF